MIARAMVVARQDVVLLELHDFVAVVVCMNSMVRGSYMNCEHLFRA